MDNEIDAVYNEIDDLLLSGDFKTCNNILSKLNPSELSKALIISYLIVTYRAREKLPERLEFSNRAYRFLKESGGEEENKWIKKL